jgi:soluble lytic murein transglycosylase-like protein
MWLLLAALTAQAQIPPGALTAMRKRDCQEVLRLTQGIGGLAPSVARARCGNNIGLEERLGSGGSLEPYARLLVANNIINSRPERALELLEGIVLPGKAGEEVRLVRGRALINVGRSLEARDDLRSLLDSDFGPEARYWLAWGAELRHETEEALDTYRATWSRHPESHWAFKAEQHILALAANTVDLATVKGRVIAIAYARNLVKAHQAEKALPMYMALQTATGDVSPTWILERAMAAFAARDYPLALELFDVLNPLKAGTHGRAETLYHYALALSRTGEYGAAEKAYARLMVLYPKARRADTASFKLGYLAWDELRLEEAVREFKRHLKKNPASKHADEAKWFLGNSLLRLEEPDAADGWFERVKTEHPQSSLAPPALYWQARIQGMQGNASAETAILESLLEAYPVSGHAWYAAQRLGKRYGGLTVPALPPVPAAFSASHPSAGIADRLVAMGHLDWAADHARTLIPDAKKADEDTKLAVAGLLMRSGAYVEAKALVKGACSSNPRKSRTAALAICFPVPERDVVEGSAVGIPALLPYAVMTAESSLQPGVTSPAGARGLMQLMPKLGEELHGLMLEGTYDPEWLYVPGYNAWLGTTELSRLAKEYSKRGPQPALPTLIAAYNGGAINVDRWISQAGQDIEFDAFADSISYTETRRYVRRVLGFLVAYRITYGDPASIESPDPSPTTEVPPTGG